MRYPVPARFVAGWVSGAPITAQFLALPDDRKQAFIADIIEQTATYVDDAGRRCRDGEPLSDRFEHRLPLRGSQCRPILMRTVRQFRDRWYHYGTVPDRGARPKNEQQRLRAALYLRVSHDDQTTENQRLVLGGSPHIVAGRSSTPTKTRASAAPRGAINGPRSTRCSRTRCGDGSISAGLVHRSTGRSVLHVASALAELDAAGVALLFRPAGDRPHHPDRPAMIQMASIFGEQEREMIRSVSWPG